MAHVSTSINKGLSVRLNRALKPLCFIGLIGLILHPCTNIFILLSLLPLQTDPSNSAKNREYRGEEAEESKWEEVKNWHAKS